MDRVTNDKLTQFLGVQMGWAPLEAEYAAAQNTRVAISERMDMPIRFILRSRLPILISDLSFYDLVCSVENRLGNRYTDLFCGFQIDDQLEVRCLLDG